MEISILKLKSIISVFDCSYDIFAPTVFLNSAEWAQCDSIYVAFIVISLIYMLKDKYLLAFIFYGIAFSFKLQAVFILPLYLFIYFVYKKFSCLYFLIVPFVIFLSGMPCFIMGRENWLEVFKVYFDQTNTFKKMNMNFNY